MSYVGQPVRRVEDRRLIQGQGRYVDDVHPAGTLEVAFVRSPHASAWIVAIDAAAVESLPGVAAILTGRELAAVVRPLRPTSVIRGFKEVDYPALAVDRVRHVGEGVVAVAAADRYVAEDAVDLIEVEYDPLPAVVDPETAARPDSPRVHDELPDNILVAREFRVGDYDGAAAGADLVLRETFRIHRQGGLPLEPRGCLAEWDPGAETLTVRSATQVPHLLRSTLADLLGLAEWQVRVLTGDVGGGFGVKSSIYPEEIVCAYLSLRLGRPVKWIEDRRENLTTTTHARDQIHEVEVAALCDGTIVGLHDRILCDVGAYSIYPWTAAIEPLMAGGSVMGPYRIQNYHAFTAGVATNKFPEGPYRGVARPATTFVMERIVDLVAAKLGLDPAEVRRRNLVRAEDFPYRSATGLIYDGASFIESLDLAREKADYGALRAEQARLRKQGRLIGIGLGCYVEITAFGSKTPASPGTPINPAHEAATVRIDPAGTVTVLCSVASTGQAHATSLAQIAADGLGVPIESVRVIVGDTNASAYGFGTFASRSAVMAGGAIIKATAILSDKVRRIAGSLLEASPDDLEIVGGSVRVRGAPAQAVPLRQVARLAHYQIKRLPEGMDPGLEVTGYYDPQFGTSANGTHLAVVEVDPETGQVQFLRYIAVEDCGNQINPLVVEGQTHGGVAQGIGSALYEELVYDETGQLLTGSLMDYLLPGPREVPDIEAHHLVTPSTITLGGFKGTGEGGTLGASAAVPNAIADALLPLGVRVTEIPLTPDRIRAAVRHAASADRKQDVSKV